MSLLELNEHEAVGIVDEMFDWATRFARDGKLRRSDAKLLSEAIKFDRHTDEATIKALIAAGFLDSTRWGYAFHGFMERNGTHLREAERKRKIRARVRGQSKDAARTVRRQSAPTGRDVDVTGRKEPSPAQTELSAGPPGAETAGRAGDLSPGPEQGRANPAIATAEPVRASSAMRTPASGPTPVGELLAGLAAGPPKTDAERAAMNRQLRSTFDPEAT